MKHTLALAIPFVALTSIAATKTLVVSPRGISPHQALERIRAAKASGDKSAWTIEVQPGLYPFEKPLVFTPADSGTPEAPVRWIGGMQSMRGTEPHPVFAGGKYLEGWKDTGYGWWETPIPKDKDGKYIVFESLYVNGRRAEIARIPDKGAELHFKDWKETPIVENGVTNGYLEAATPVEPGELGLEGLTKEELRHVLFKEYVKWSFGSYPIDAYNAAKREITVSGSKASEVKPWKRWNEDPHNYFHLENVRAGFKLPGQWFYDVKNGKVLYRPLPEDRIDELKALAPTAALKSIIRFDGDVEKGDFVHDIAFEGIAVTASRTDGDVQPDGIVKVYNFQAAVKSGGAVYGVGAHRITFDRCWVNNTENYAFWFAEGCCHVKIQNSEIYDAGAGGIWFGCPKSNFLQATNPGWLAIKDKPVSKQPWDNPLKAYSITNTTPAAVRFNTVDNCLITHCGRVNPEGCGIVLTDSADSVVTHNEISDLFYTGVSVGWTWGYWGSYAQRNEISYNVITNIGQHLMADMGGIYTLGTSFGTKIHHNYIADVDSISYGGWAMYNDEGSEGIHWFNNFCIDTSTESYHMHFGRECVVENCVMINGRQSSLAISRSENHQQVHFKNNIIYRYDGPFVLKNCAMQKGWCRTSWDGNLFWSANGETDLNGPVSGLVADPKFADPKNGDWSVQPDSPAIKLGFKPWNYFEAGRRKAF